MGRITLATVFSMLALISPAAAAGATQIFVGSDPDSTVVFKVEADIPSVIGLDAPFYCSETEPSRRFGPGTISVFKRSARLREGAGGLEALLVGGSGPSSKVAATFDGTRFAGTFAFDFSEESIHCQTAGFYPARPEVDFEALLYEPIESGPAPPSGGDAIPVYYGTEGGAEVLLEPNPKSVVLRGSVPSKCPVAGKKSTTARAPMFGDVIDTVREGGSFHRTIRRHRNLGAQVWSETASVSGVVGEDEIAGFYERSTTTRSAGRPSGHCTTGPVSFRALRYVRAVGSPPAT